MIFADYIKKLIAGKNLGDFKGELIMTQKNFVKDFQSLIPVQNDSGYKRILAIGDIHGEFTKLMSLWKKSMSYH